MATPTKKMYDRKGKLIFDPSNPEDVRRQEEINKQIEMAKELFSIVDPRGGGGIGAMARGISKAALANMAKSKFAQNKATQILELFGKKPMIRGKKAVTKKATNTVKEVAEKPVEIVKETLSRLLKPIPKLNKSKSFTTAKAKNALDEIPKDKPAVKTKPTKSDEVIPKINRKESYSPVKPNSIGSFKIGESAVGTSQTSKVIPKTIPSNIPKATEKIKDSDNLFKNRYGKEEFKKIYSDFDKFKLNDDVINNSFLKGLSIAGASGVGTGTVYFSMKNKSDVKLDETKLKDSTKYKGVKIIKVDGKDKGIIKDNKTGKWRYFNEDKDGELLPQKLKPQERKVTGGGYTPIDKTKKDNEVKKQEKSGLAIGGGDGGGGSKSPNNGGGSGDGNNQKTTTGGTGSNKSTTGGGTTTPRSKTGQAFDKAFAEARKQAGGAGGIFEFNNKKYGTALEGETVPKNRVEVGKTTTPVTIKNDYPTTKTDPTLEMAMEQDSIRQQMATKPLSSIVFKPTSKAVDVRNVMDEQDALRSIRVDNKLPLKKKRYGGNLAMLKYMK
jgi:hypothetical protein